MSIVWDRESDRVSFGLAAIIAVVVAAIVCFSNTGCRYKVNSNNPQVIMANDLNSAARVTDLVADGLLAAHNVIESLKTQEPEYYVKADKMLKELAVFNDAAINSIRIVKTGGSADWRGALLAISAHASTFDLTTFGFKNHNTQAVVKIGLASLTAVLQAIPESFGTQNGVQK